MVAHSLWFYLEKTLMPWGLSPLYELPARVSLGDPRFLLPAFGVTAITATVVLLRHRWPAGLAAWVYYAIALGPVIGIVHSGHQLVNDRYSYLPAMGFALLIGAAAGATVRAGAAGALRPAFAKAVIGLIVLWLGSLAYLSTQQVMIWRDTESLWRYAIEVDPECAICHGNLGVHLLYQGYHQAAKTEFDRVKEIRPDGKKVHMQLGYMHVMYGEFGPAVEHFKQYVERYPNDADGLNNLGAALVNDLRAKEALAPLQRAVELKPRYALSYVSLGYAHLQLGEPAQAKSMFRRAIALKYDTPQAWYGLARVNLETGNTDAAHKAWGLLGQLDPKLAERFGPLLLPTW
jgi:Tfp pilus assembly protein PilF